MTLFDWAETATATLPPREVRAERKPQVKDAVIFNSRQDGSTTAYLRRDWTEAEVERLREMDDEGKSSAEMAEVLKRTVASVDAAIDRYIRPRPRKNNIIWTEANRERLAKMYVEDKMTPTEIGQSMRIDTTVIHNALLLHPAADRRRQSPPMHVLRQDVLVYLDRQPHLRPLQTSRGFPMRNVLKKVVP
jgi:hypothetical protein